LSADGPVAQLSDSDFEGVTYIFQTTRSSIRSTPKWKPNEEFPPLSPRKAEAAALGRAHQLRPDVSTWNTESICLNYIGDDWFYLVKLWRADIAITGLPYFLEVPVLMDGNALPAKKK